MISGLGGNDTLEGGLGPDVLDGGSGTDTASYAGAPAGVTASLGQSSGNTGEAAGDTYTNIENLAGSAFTDTLTGDGNANTIDGGGGNDTITGNGGNDFLFGSAGNDTFVFQAGFGNDTIGDFEAALPSAMSLRSAPHSLRTLRWCKPTRSRSEPTLSLRMTPTIQSH